MIIWLRWMTGAGAPPTAFYPASWHAHALLFGYLPAVMGGFLLTAIPNWTGRPSVNGGILLTLVMLWLLGRIVVLLSFGVSPFLIAAADLSYMVMLIALAGRDIITAKMWRNLPVIGLMSVFTLGNAVFHWEGGAVDGIGMRLGLSTAILLILLIGGRVTPLFTRNWLKQHGSTVDPAAMGKFDSVSLAVTAVSLILWIAAPFHLLTGVGCMAAGILQAVRLTRWGGHHTLAEPMVTILHIGFGFAPLGLVLLGWSVLSENPALYVGAIHAWTVGAIGIMTIAIMTRATLGHTGRKLHATWPIAALYAAVVLAAILRIAVVFFPNAVWMTHMSGMAWIAAFAIFVLVFGPMMVRAKLD